MPRLYDFNETQKLTKPLVIGRLVRFILGVATGYFVYMLLLHGINVVYSLETNAMTWFALTASFALVNHVVNIGFGKNYGRKPQTWLLYALFISIVISLQIEGKVLGTSSMYLIYAYLLYFWVHLGISLILASIIGTPGCEMRAIPHLYTLLSGNKTGEHFCPGFIGKVDEWELRISSRHLD